MSEWTAHDQACLTRFLHLTSRTISPRMSPKVSQWAQERRWEVAGLNFATLDVESLPDKYAAAQAVYDQYRKYSGIAAVTRPANVTDVMECLARQKLHADSWAALRQHDPALADKISATLSGYVWQNDFLHQQTIDVTYVVNTLYAKTISAHGYMTPKMLERQDERKTAKAPVKATNTKLYDDVVQLKAEVEKFLEIPANKVLEFTNGQVANALGCGAQWKLVGKALNELCSDPKSPVVFRKTRNAAGKEVWLYKSCLERKLMKANPERTHELVKDMILLYIQVKEDHDVSLRCKRGVRSAMRRYFGTIANTLVDECLRQLVHEGRLTTSHAAKGGTAYSPSKTELRMVG